MNHGITKTEEWIRLASDSGAFPRASAAVGTTQETLLRLEWPPIDHSILIYDLASLTKILATTMSTLRLVDRKVIGISDRISRFITVPSDKRHIRILDLLTHTAGFPASYLLAEAVAEHRGTSASSSTDPILETILSRPLEYATGTAVVYSCIGYIVLAKILERIASSRIDRISRELVFEPLGLGHTRYLPIGDDRSSTEIAAPTEYDAETGVYLQGVVHDENARFQGGVSGNAGLFSSLDDCATFSRLMLSECEGFLSRDTYEMTVTDHTRDLPLSRGLGVSLYRPGVEWQPGDALGPGAFGHTGFTGTSMYISPGLGLYFVLLTNRVHLGRNLEAMPDYRRQFHEIASAEFSPHRT